MCVSVDLRICMCTIFEFGEVRRGHQDSHMGLKLKAVVNCFVGAGNHTDPLQSSKCS